MKNTPKQKTFYMRTFTTLINVKKIVTVHYQALPKNYASAEEAHDFWELIYSDKQDIEVVIDGTPFRVRQGETVFIRPNAPHYVLSGNVEPNIFILSFACNSKSMEYFTGKILAIPENRRVLLETIMAEAQQTFIIPDFDPALKKLERKDPPNLGGEQLIKNSLEILLVYLLRVRDTSSPQTFFVSKSDTSGELQDRIVSILAKKLYEPFSLDDLCRTLAYGKTHLCTVFREKTGTSIYATFLKMKLTEAKKLIRRGKSFQEISELLAFNSLPHFTHTFKKFTGMTPNEYRASIRQSI